MKQPSVFTLIERVLEKYERQMMYIFIVSTVIALVACSLLCYNSAYSIYESGYAHFRIFSAVMALLSSVMTFFATVGVVSIVHDAVSYFRFLGS